MMSQSFTKISADLKKRLKKHLIAKMRQEESKEVVVTTAYRLGPAQMDKIVKSLESGPELRFVNIVDPEVLGGFSIQKGSQRFDATVGGRVAQIARKLGATLGL